MTDLKKNDSSARKRVADMCYRAVNAAAFLFHKSIRRKTFMLNGRSYRYFCGKYGETWKTERAIEVPVAMDLLAGHSPGQVLEIGNVLRHYFQLTHNVVDKYEKFSGVVNEDVVSFRPSQKFSLIVTISTLEHVGWEETPVEPDKIFRAVGNLVDMLSPEGMLFFSVPVGYRRALDEILRDGLIPGAELHFMKRIGFTTWIESEWRDVEGARFSVPWPGANALAFGFIKKKESPDE